MSQGPNGYLRIAFLLVLASFPTNLSSARQDSAQDTSLSCSVAAR